MLEPSAGRTWESVGWCSGNLLNRYNLSVGFKSPGYIFFRYTFVQTPNEQPLPFSSASTSWVGHFRGWWGQDWGVVTELDS